MPYVRNAIGRNNFSDDRIDMTRRHNVLPREARYIIAYVHRCYVSMTATCDPGKFTGNALSRANTIYLHKSLHNLHFCLISAYANRLLDYKLKR